MNSPEELYNKLQSDYEKLQSNFAGSLRLLAVKKTDLGNAKSKSENLKEELNTAAGRNRKYARTEAELKNTVAMQKGMIATMLVKNKRLESQLVEFNEIKTTLEIEVTKNKALTDALASVEKNEKSLQSKIKQITDDFRANITELKVKNKQLAQSYIIRSKIFIMVNRPEAAIGQLNTAKEFAHGNTDLINTLNNEIKKIKTKFKLAKKHSS